MPLSDTALRTAQFLGMQVTRTISMGNAAILNEADYLEYLAWDPETQYIGIYIEGPRDGRRFFQTLREVTKHKPVVIFKGGTTAHGASAARTHTTSLATPTALWEAMVRDTQAKDRDEILAIEGMKATEQFDVIDREMKAATRRVRNMLAEQVNGKGWGALCQISAISASGTAFTANSEIA